MSKVEDRKVSALQLQADARKIEYNSHFSRDGEQLGFLIVVNGELICDHKDIDVDTLNKKIDTSGFKG
jgi:hypothetical protein